MTMAFSMQAKKVSILLLALVLTTKAARITKHGADVSSISPVNEFDAFEAKGSTFEAFKEKQQLWEKIEAFVGQGVKTFDNWQVHGTVDTIGSWKPKDVTEINLDGADPSQLVFAIGAIPNPWIQFSKAWSYRDGEVLVLQGDASICNSYPDCPQNVCNHMLFPGDDPKFKHRSHDSKFLEKFLAPGGNTFNDLVLSLSSKLSGHPRKGLWHGTLQTPMSSHRDSLHHGWDGQHGAWKVACQGQHLNSWNVIQGNSIKMVIPLEYNSFNAVKGLEKVDGKAAEYFEKLAEGDANSSSAFVELKRLLSYRHGLLYLMYKCYSTGSGSSLQDPYIRIERASLMIQHESKDKYSISSDAGKVLGEYTTGPTFLSRDNN